MAAWLVQTIEPEATGRNYFTLVHRLAGYAPDAPTPLEVENTGANTFTMYYRKKLGAPANIDSWDTTIPFVDSRPHTVTIKAVLRATGAELGKETPDVADGTGGGGSKKTKKITFKKVVKGTRDCPKP